MNKYKVTRDSAICELLKYICDYRELPESAYSNADTAETVKECADLGFLENVRTVRTLDGRVHPSAMRPFVTQKGIDFLSQEDQTVDAPSDSTPLEHIAGQLERMNDDMRQDHAEEKTEKKIDRRFQLLNTLFGALLGAVLTLAVEHWSEIFTFFSGLFQ